MRNLRDVFSRQLLGRGRHLASLAALLTATSLLAACSSGAPTGKTSSPAAMRSTHQQLQQSRPSFTHLTPAQRAEATRQPWDVPGHTIRRPSQRVLNSMKRPYKAPPVKPSVLAAQRAFVKAWSGREKALRAQGVDEATIVQKRMAFKGKFFAQHH